MRGSSQVEPAHDEFWGQGPMEDYRTREGRTTTPNLAERPTIPAVMNVIYDAGMRITARPPERVLEAIRAREKAARPSVAAK